MNVNDLTIILNIIRRTTTFVKIMPFVVAVMILSAMVMQIVFAIDTSAQYDLLVYQSPLNILFLILLSYLLKLCIWHRLECALPLIPIASVYVDENICELSHIAAYANYAIVVILFVASLINAYFIFIKPNRKRK